MANFNIQAPDGKSYNVSGETAEGALAALQQYLAPKAAPPDQGALAASTRSVGKALSFNLMDDAVARAAAGVVDPVIGWVTGKDMGTYDERLNRHLASQHSQDAAAEAQHPVASTVGTAGAFAAVAPRAVAGLAGPAMRAATAGERLINAGIAGGKGAAGGGLYSFLSGYGAGEGGVGERIHSGLEQVPTGALLGLGLGGTLGAFSKMPVVPPSKVAAASDRSGVYVPEALASEDPRIQQAGGAAKSIPVFGTRITNAGKRTVEEFTAEKARIAEGFGGGAAATPKSAGQEAKDALADWVGPLTEGVITNEYNAVDALINPTITTPLNETARIATDIVRRRTAATLKPGDAVNEIRRAVSMPGGLTYHGIKDLRTHVREMMKTPSLVHGDMSEGELKQIYSGLTKDLRTATENAGGIAARKAFDKANLLNAAVEKRRTELMQVLGVNPKNPATHEEIFSAIQRKAGSKSSADADGLNKIRKSMPKDAWDQVASGVVGELGRSDALGTVSLDRFFTGYNQLSDAGKAALFGNKPDLKAALDDLATIAGGGKEVAKWANPSGTAQHGAYIAMGAAAGHPTLWPKLAVSALGAHFLTRALTRPATVRAMSAWARVWQANQINRLGSGGPAQKNIQSLQFVSRRFASEIGLQFKLGADQVRQLADSLSGNAPATANPDANANNR